MLYTAPHVNTNRQTHTQEHTHEHAQHHTTHTEILNAIICILFHIHFVLSGYFIQQH